MNAKIKAILQQAWNEPRHFFFWLGLSSLLGFFIIVFFFGEFGGKPVAFLALACALLFILSVPAFILAWIPPVRRFLARALPRRFLILALLATLVVLFYAVENWRGRQAWQTFKRNAEASGERLGIAAIAPPPVPPAENFFETPLWTDLHLTAPSGKNAWRYADFNRRVIFGISGPGSGKVPSLGNFAKAEGVDLAAWQAYFRSTNNIFPAKSGGTTNYFPVARQPQAPASDVLLALSRFNSERELLKSAAARPQARFWVNWDSGFGVLLPHLSRIKEVERYLALHAQASLASRDNAAAFEDVQLALRLVNTIRLEPILISQLVRIASLHLALQPIWQGLADHAWTAGQLTAIEKELAHLDFPKAYQRAIRGEWACALWGVDYVQKYGPAALENAGAPPADSNTPQHPRLERGLGQVVFEWIPQGWFDQNKLTLSRRYRDWFLPVADPEHRVISPQAAEKTRARLRTIGTRPPYDFFSAIFLPSIYNVSVRFAQAQTYADLAQVACALERFRLSRGRYPDSLDALAPEFIERLPHEVINREPLRYRPLDNGQYLLYSVGWNDTDDGGKVELTKSGNVDWMKGDWVWRF